MNHQVQVYEIGRDARAEDRPKLKDTFAVTTETREDAREAALERLRAAGFGVRSISFTKEGGIAAVVHPPAPAEAQIGPRVRHARGGR